MANANGVLCSVTLAEYEQWTKEDAHIIGALASGKLPPDPCEAILHSWQAWECFKWPIWPVTEPEYRTRGA